MRGLRLTASIAVLSLVTSAVWVASSPLPAGAADPGVDKLVETLDGASNSLQSWSKELDKLGKLADSLPSIPTSPGSVLGFDDLVHQWFNNGTKKLADAVDDGDLDINQPIDLGGTDGRVGTLITDLETLGNGDKQLDIHIEVAKTVHNQAASVAVPVGSGSNAPQSAFSAQGGIDLTVEANLTFRLIWDHVSNTVYFVNDEATVPALHVDASATIADASAAKASIGILGVSLAGDSTLNLNAHFAATVNDPNNDGRLAFENTDHTAGELAQAGSLAGLVSFGFASPAGALNASLHLNAAPTSSFSLSLPAVDATIAVAWPNIATGGPTVTPTGINVAGKFLNMTPRDLADGVAQLVTTLTSIQRSKFGPASNPVGNLDLPFIKGSLADAIQLNEALKKFLKDNTIDGAVDAARAGQPTFVSIQELLDRLNVATGLPGGATIGISDVHYTDATSKLDFKITLHRAAPSSAVDLNAATAASSGGTGSTYTATTLTDSGQNWAPNAFAGHHVVAGASGATIESNTATTLTLQAPGWTPTTPTAGSPYTISGGQGNVGAVELGNALKSSGKGVGEANAVNATAKVKASYDASITLVLDLQQSTIHNPPIEQHNPDGSAVLVESTPTGPDRVLLRTSGSPALFTADFPIDAGVDIFANAGFLQVELKGNAKVCHTNAGATCSGTPGPNDHMLAINLKDNGDLTFGQVVAKLLTDPGSLLDVDVNVRAAGGVDVSVPGTTDFFGGASAHASFSWNDLTSLTGPNGPQFDVSDLSELVNFDFDPANPKALYSIILKTLQTLSGAISDANPAGASIFSQQIPLVGRSLRDLLRADESGMGPQVTYGANTLTDASRSNAKGNAFASNLVGRSVVAGTQVGIVQSVSEKTLTMSANWSTQPATGTAYILRSELDDAISILEASPSDNLQALVRTLDERLAGTPLSFEYKDMGAPIGPAVLIHVDWARSYHTSAPVQFDFNLPIGDQKLAGVQGSGNVSLGVDGHVKVGLVVPLQAGDGPPGPSDLKILDDSSIGVKLNASVENATIGTTVGPLTLSLGDPTSSDKATAKASYSLDLAKSGGTGAAQDFASFMGAVAPAINATSDAVDCGFGGGTALALCARLPLYISDNGGTTYTKLITTAGASNEFALRLPKSTSPFSDYFNLGGAQIDGHNRIETPDPTELGNAILSHIIDFTQINGIDGFLHLIEQGLNAASFGGKLPLIGDDLQQGADFVGKLRASIHDAIGQLPGDGHFTDTSGVRDWVNDKLAGALDSAGLNPDLVNVDTECSDRLAQAGAPTVTPSPTGGGQTVKYAIAAYVKDSSNNVHESTVSTLGQTTDGPTTIDGSHTLALTWAAVTGADGYHVYREVSGQLKFLKDVTGGTSYTDNGSDTPTADGPENPAQNPRLHNCSYTNFDSVKIRVDVSQGKFNGSGDLDCASAPAGHECLSKSVPLDIGVPGLSLQSHEGAGPTVELGWHLHLAFGISRSDGFFVDTKDEGDIPELALGLNFRIPADLEAELAFINITAHNCTNSSGDQGLGCGADAPASVAPLFGGSFSVNLTSPDPSGRLTVSDLSGASLDNLFDPKIKAAVNIDWLLKAKVGEEAGFPGIQAEFRMAWAWSNADLKNKAAVGAPTIAFVNVGIDTGEVFGHVLSPIVNQIKKVTGPLDPVVKTLYAPIPVLSDLSHLVGGDDITIISLAKSFSTLADGPDLTFVDTILSVVNFINHFPTCTTSCLIPLGSFQLSGQKAVDNTVAPGNTESFIQSKTLSPQATGGLLDDFNGKDSSGTNSFGGANSPSAKAGFSFPVFENPSSLFNLILGGDVDLVKFDSGNLTLAFDWRQQFGPVYAPPPVVITLHGSASVSLRIVAGFDTYGIRKAFEKARAGELDLSTVGEAILQSLFFYTTDDNGKPLPVVQFTGEIAAGAAVSAVVITVGIEGGVGLTVSFLWNDPNHDGKFRISEFLQSALNNPICLFTVSGRLYVFLKLYITVGFSPFSVTFDFTIVDVTLLDFSAAPDCAPPPPKLGGLSGDGKTLVIYAAALGHTAQRGHSSYESNDQEKETVKITSLHNYDVNPPAFTGVSVTMLGIKRDFTNSSIERVIVDGRGYAKPMSVTFIGDAKADTSSTGPPPPTAQFDRDAIVFGGTANDVIKAGIGNSWVDGGAGDDLIVTGDRTVLNADKTDYVAPNAKARVAGGPGADSITVGNGDDIVAGDSHLGNPPPTTSLSLKDIVNDGRDAGDPLASGQGQSGAGVTVPNWASLPNPADGTDGGGGDGRDTVKVGLGHSTAYGNGHNDTLGVGADDPLAKSRPAQAAMFTSPGATLVGGDGSDNFAGGTGPDTIYTACQTATSIDGTGCTDNATAGDPPGSPVNIVDTGTGNDTVHGGTGQDRVTGHSLPPASPAQHDDIRGGSGRDILVGGFGTDALYGGPDDDYVIAEPATVDIPASPGDDGFGPVYTVTHIPLPQGVVSQPKTLVGGLGRDHIIGGDGSASVYGDQQTTPCVAGSPVASDPVDETVNNVLDGNDKITGGAGVENVRAGGGNDNVDVKGSDDLACGEKGDDVIHGGSENDQTWGGSGKDTLYGDAGTDKLYGNDDNDAIYGGDDADEIEGNNGVDWASGSNGSDIVIGGTRAAGRADTGDFLFGDNDPDTIIGDNGNFVGGRWIPLDLSGSPATAGGEDMVWGGAANDVCYGGIANDTLYGGTGNDHCEGNNADDTILGESGEDELIGGSFEEASNGVGRPDGTDTISGGSEADVITGDNAIVATVAAAAATDTVKGRAFVNGHTIVLLDLGYSPAAANSDGDELHGNDDTDVVYGQGGDDTITGDAEADYAEGGPGIDTINGNDGADDLVGGSSTLFDTGVGQPDKGDTIHGDAADDVIIGDNGKVIRDPAATPHPVTDRAGMSPQRAIALYDLGPAPHANSSGDDIVTGDDAVDVIFGQDGKDRLKGNDGDDYVEGDQDGDAIEGDAGHDDLVGGSSTPQSGSGDATVGQLDSSDAIYGGPGDDVETGDNARVLRVGARTKTVDRLGSDGGTRVPSRNITLFDLNGPNFLTAPPANLSGDDRISGGSGVDVAYGQDGNDQMSGGPNDDYMEGNGGNDVLRGDVRLDQPPTNPAEAATTLLSTVWPGTASGFADLEGAGPDGQDDMLGGSSMPAFRDNADSLEGDGESDFQLGDNGILRRDIQGNEPNASDRKFVQRYPDGPLPANAAVVRVGDTSVNPNGSTRFCTTAQATCEAAAASGNDTMYGDGGDDTMWGQDGNDVMHGNDQNDDMYGELGNDTMFGEDGDDAILGDRGGVVDELMNPSDIGKQFTVTLQNPPKETYVGMRQGTLDHRIDLLHDINGDVFVGSSSSAAMPHPGLNEGGNDRIRGGLGQDNIHAGFGDDLANGDSGGDVVFGDDGTDVIWGGQGCDRVANAGSPDCLSNGTFNPSSRGDNDRFVDHIYGGVGGTSSGAKKDASGSDIMDWRPRGTYATCTANAFPVTTKNVTVDPCVWFEMTGTDDDTADPATTLNNQHHDGTDWMYGGWDRDVMQGDVSGNGPNPGDRLIDWNGAYNLYTACNSAYGGFNDVRQHSPAMQTFLQQLTFGDGAGQVAADTSTSGRSGYRELALAYPGETDHSAGPAYPSTPGHFDDPYSCTS